MITTKEKNWATLTHLSSLSQYCIPMGNFVLPLIIWSSKKDDSQLIDDNGKQVLNFQLSIFLYSLVLAGIFISAFTVCVFSNIPLSTFESNSNINLEDYIFNENIELLITGIIAIFFLACLKIIEFFLIIQASVKTSNGESYRYPLTIRFIK